MNKEEIIDQLESLRENSLDFAKRAKAAGEKESIWFDDIEALDCAIEIIKNTDCQRKEIQGILAERQRQNEKWGLQNHELPAWMAILGEEFGELCEAVNETYFDNGADAKQKGGYENLYTEATHVAAVAIQIMEFLNRTYPQGEES